MQISFRKQLNILNYMNEGAAVLMHIIIEVKDTDNIIGLKENIAMRLEGIADIVRIDVREE